MILKLNPGNKGYCFLFKILKKNLDTTDSYMANVNQESELLFETKCWAYEDDDLLQYIDDGHLPTCIIDVIETNYPNLFYSNFIITEIWDYRQSYGNLVCDINYTLLRPSIQSIIVDVASLTSNGEWSSKEKLALEAEIIKASAPPLCLDPDPIHGELAITAQHTSQIFNTRSIKRKARKFSQVGINRKRKLIQYTQYHGPDLCASIARNQKSSPSNCKKYKQTNEIYMPAPSLDLPELSVPSNIDVFRYVKDENASFMQNEDLLKQINHEESQLIEEYIFNIYKKEGLVCIDNIKLCILQRLINLELYGELTVEYYQKDGIKNYRSCEFVLGTRAQANRFMMNLKK
ncbi:transcription factor SPT20 homolog [Ctenocephalides felis]|uniref:transcription factor SPT20 homolog n=1 Tax=Ctenocephalides felis TaxID=7515 RepID=UPI000E6E1AED|nr:transcription factor SPT20 homolog [Ctenocephalides felis]